MQVTPRIEPGHVFTAFHFPEVRTNLLIGQSSDVNTSCPEYKVVAVAIEPAGDRASEPLAAEPAVADLVLKQVSLDGGTDEVAVELPLEIRLNGAPVAVTMRTPGHDFELAAGFLYGEGIVSAAPEMTLPEDLAANIVDAVAADALAPATRRFYTTSSCGICGKGALEEVEAIAPVVSGGPSIPRALLAELPDRLRQPTFERTGGLHATGLFSAAGELLEVREDVGRHNAMDKVIGRALLAGALPLTRARAVRERAAGVRAGAEDGPGRRADPGRRGRPDVAGGGARGGPRHHARGLRPRRARERVHARRARVTLAPPLQRYP